MKLVPGEAYIIQNGRLCRVNIAEGQKIEGELPMGDSEIEISERLCEITSAIGHVAEQARLVVLVEAGPHCGCRCSQLTTSPQSAEDRHLASYDARPEPTFEARANGAFESRDLVSTGSL